MPRRSRPSARLRAGFRMASLGVAVLVVALGAASSGLAQPAQKELPTEAQRRLETILGTWDSTWEWVDAEGTVVRSAQGIEEATWAIEGRVVLLTTTIPSLEAHSKAFMFYSEADELFRFVSVDSKGDLWLLAGGLDEFVITSEPKPRPGGGDMIIRFTHHETDDDHFSAVMETSVDRGQSWRVATHQQLVRRRPQTED